MKITASTTVATTSLFLTYRSYTAHERPTMGLVFARVTFAGTD